MHVKQFSSALFKPKMSGQSDTKAYHDDDGGDDFESVKHFPYRLVGPPGGKSLIVLLHAFTVQAS